MAATTRQAIIDYTIKLAGEKPIKKITINDITKGCGITRNTFYYHFRDIYDVLDQTMGQEIEKLKTCSPEDYDRAMFDVIEFVVMYKKVWKNLYISLGREDLQKYIMSRLHSIFMGYIKLQDTEGTVPQMDLDIICAFYEEALFGVLVRWINGDTTTGEATEMHAISDRIRILFADSVKLMLKNSKEHSSIH